MRVLVLMATRNGAEWIAEQVDSIAAQRGCLRLSLAVCDDGSSDNTLAVLQQRAADVQLPLCLVQSAVTGGSAGRNFFRLISAVDTEQCDFVALCDQDDIWLPDKTRHAVDALRASDTGGYSAAVDAFWPGDRTLLLRQTSRTTAADHLFEGAGQGCSFVLKAQLFQRLQTDLRRHAARVAELHYHDWVLYALTRSYGQGWLFDERPGLRYRQHGSNDTGARTLGAGLLKRLRMVRSGWYGEQVRGVANLCAVVAPGGSATAYLGLIDSARRAPAARAALAAFVLRHGRRRWADRLVLLVAALAGWL